MQLQNGCPYNQLHHYYTEQENTFDGGQTTAQIY